MADRFRAGDLVDVKTPDEILATLDENGTVGALPFMPEMVPMCGRRFRVARRVVKACFYGRMSTMLSFRGSDVVTLKDARCSGDAHDGCEKGCAIFWREDWLRRVNGGAPAAESVDGASSARLRERLKTKSGERTYFCQASELLNATVQLSQKQRLLKAFDEVAAGNCGVVEMIWRIAIWTYWRIRRRFAGELAAGTRAKTPTANLGLCAGDGVRVKPLARIAETLNPSARNRGLYFTPDMARLCGRQERVKGPLHKIIVDGTGEMRDMHDTVFLEDSYCGCAHVAFGGCSRNEFAYWREIWLERADGMASTSSPERA